MNNPQLTYEEIRLREFQAILDNIRYECQDLIDAYYLAFKASGRDAREWALVSDYEHHLFKALSTEKLSFEEKRGALKLVRAYLKSITETLQLEALYRVEARHEELREP